MWLSPDYIDSDEAVFLAGERVSPGSYRLVGGRREVVLESEDILPATLDGRVGCYMRVDNTWGSIAQDNGV